MIFWKKSKLWRVASLSNKFDNILTGCLPKYYKNVCKSIIFQNKHYSLKTYSNSIEVHFIEISTGKFSLFTCVA